MNAREKGFLLLTGYLGEPDRRPLTVAQFRDLARRMRLMEKPTVARELCAEDLLTIGCSRAAADRILRLLSQTEQLEYYLRKGEKAGCVPVTRVSDAYPVQVRRRLGLDAPGVLWAKGDLAILQTPAIALVGSRDLQPDNRHFAEEAGRQAALQGYTLVSGNARGADRTAQESCLACGGKVISIVADELETHPRQANILYLSETGFDMEFSAHRALQRNSVIHSLGSRTFVAQCRLEKGGTWEGTKTNLRHGYTPVFFFRDGSPASLELQQMGAKLIEREALQKIDALQGDEMCFIDQ